MAEFLTKTFVAANGTDVVAHDTSWVATHTSYHTGVAKITSNRVHASGGTGWAMVRNTATPPAADYEVAATLRRGAGTDGQVLVVARYRESGATGAPSGYAFSFSDFGYAKLLKYEFGGLDTLVGATEVPAMAEGTIFKIRVRVEGNVISGYLNDEVTPFLTYTDTGATPITTAGGVAFSTSVAGDSGLATVVSITAADLTPSPNPVLTSPAGSASGATSASGTVSTNKTGGSMRALASANDTESPTTIKASGITQSVTSAGSQSVSLGSLTPSSPYRIHYLHEHPDGDSAVVSSPLFYTQDVAGARDTPAPLGTVIVRELSGGSASPPSAPVDVPAGAQFVAIFVDEAGYPAPSGPVVVATNFTGAAKNYAQRQSAAAIGVHLFVAPVTSTGTGKTITVSYGVANGLAPPRVHVLFMEKLDATYPVRTVAAFAQTSTGTAVASTAAIPTRATDLVVVRDARLANDGVAPALGSGYTTLHDSIGTVGGLGYGIAHRVKRLTTPVDGTMTASTENTQGSVILALAFRGQLQAPDTTPPTLTGSITETGKTASSISISWLAGSDNVGVAGYDVSRDGGSTWTQLGNVLSHTFTGLVSATQYQIRVRARDAAGLTSTPALSAAITTTAPDTTDPTLTGSITVGVKTATSIAMSWPAGSDNVGVTSYEVSSNAGSTWADVGNVLSHTFTGLAALTGYGLRVRAKDAAGRVSAALSAAATTYRAGATGQVIRDTTGPIGGAPAGILYNDVVLPGDAAKWFSFRVVTAPASGTLDIEPDGRFTFEGEEPASFTYQLEVDGADVGTPVLVTLYSSVHAATPAGGAFGLVAPAGSAAQTYRATPSNSTFGQTVTSTSATQTVTAIPATPANGALGMTVSSSLASSEALAQPAGGIFGQIVSSTTAMPAVPTQEAAPAASVLLALVTSTSAVQTNQAQASPAALSLASTAALAHPINLTRDIDFAEYPVGLSSSASAYPQ